MLTPLVCLSLSYIRYLLCVLYIVISQSLTPPEHLSSPTVARSLVFCVVLCGSFACLFCTFPLTITFYVIFDLRLLVTLLVIQTFIVNLRLSILFFKIKFHWLCKHHKVFSVKTSYYFMSIYLSQLCNIPNRSPWIVCL